MPKVLQDIVNLIIEKSDNDKLLALVSRKHLHSYSDEHWIDIANQMTAPELESLIKALIDFRKENNLHTGGSASPIRWLFDNYTSRYYDSESALKEWIINNTENPYEPSGSYTVRSKKGKLC